MASLQSVQYRQIEARGGIVQKSDDLCIQILLKPVQGVCTAPAVTVATATKLTLATSGTVNVDYTWANYTTVGALCAAINSAGVYQAKLLDTLSTAPTGAGLMIDGAVTILSHGTYPLYGDMSNDNYIAACVSYDAGFNVGYKNMDEHRVHIQEIVTNITCGGGADTNAFKIYERTPVWRGGGENLIYQKTPTSGTTSTTSWASGQGKITAHEGNDLLVIVTDATSMTGSLTVAAILE